MSVTVRNKRLKMSPGGMVTLPVSARRALGMNKGKGAIAFVSVGAGGVSLSVVDKDPSSLPVRISKGGQTVLPGEARACLAQGIKRHYWLEADDDGRVAVLHPYQ